MILVPHRHAMAALPTIEFNDDVDNVAVTIHRDGARPVTICNVYVRPNPAMQANALERALTALDAHASADHYVGDFNGRHQLWEPHHSRDQILASTGPSGITRAETILRFTQTAGLSIPRAPAGGSLRNHVGNNNIDGSTDIIISSTPLAQVELRCISAAGISDHDMIAGVISVPLAIYDPHSPGPPGPAYTPHRVAQLKGALL